MLSFLILEVNALGGNDPVIIRLLGRFSVERGGKRVSEPVGTPESQAWKLLKYVCANYARPIRTEELTRALPFPGSEANINNTVRVRLRRARALLDALGLGDSQHGLVLYGAGRFRMNPDYELRVDIGEAERLYALAGNPARPGAQRLTESLEALGLYSGRFLVLSESCGYIDAFRARYDGIYRGLLDTALGLIREYGEYERLDAVCESVLGVWPLDVDMHCAVLRAMLAEGLIGEAATYYSRAAVALANSGAALPDFVSLMDKGGAEVQPGGKA